MIMHGTRAVMHMSNMMMHVGNVMMSACEHITPHGAWMKPVRERIAPITSVMT